jgi:DNA primase
LIGAAEGVETALAASLAGRLPVVAAYSAGALAAWQWPQAARHIAICGDNDPAGLEAADRLAERALSAGLRVHRAIPSQPGLDWCDIWASRDECPDTLTQEAAAHA